MTVKAPLVLDPLFSSFGFMSYYDAFADHFKDDTFRIDLKIHEKSPIFETVLIREIRGAGETCRFLESIARFLEGIGLKRFCEIRLSREIGFFTKSVAASNDFINEQWKNRKEECESHLKSMWTLPGDSRVLTIQKDKHIMDITRFASALCVRKELTKLNRVLSHIRASGGRGYRPHPLIYLGEIVYLYMLISRQG